MIKATLPINRFLKKRVLWFGTQPSIDLLWHIGYAKHFKLGKHLPFIVCKEAYTLIINLNEDIAQIYGKYRSNTKNEIVRAEDMGVQFSLADVEQFENLYNQFATLNNKPLLPHGFRGYHQICTITKVELNKETLVMHAYLKDEESKRVVLLYSCSLFVQEAAEKRKLIGMSNRFLHHQSIMYFRSLGYKIYDFGGFSVSNDAKLQKINTFKLSFGGEQLLEYDYWPIWLNRLMT